MAGRGRGCRPGDAPPAVYVPGDPSRSFPHPASGPTPAEQLRAMLRGSPEPGSRSRRSPIDRAQGSNLLWRAPPRNLQRPPPDSRGASEVSPARSRPREATLLPIERRQHAPPLSCLCRADPKTRSSCFAVRRSVAFPDRLPPDHQGRRASRTHLESESGGPRVLGDASRLAPQQEVSIRHRASFLILRSPPQEACRSAHIFLSRLSALHIQPSVTPPNDDSVRRSIAGRETKSCRVA